MVRPEDYASVSLTEDPHCAGSLLGTCMPMHSVCHEAAAAFLASCQNSSVASLLKAASIIGQCLVIHNNSQCHSSCIQFYHCPLPVSTKLTVSCEPEVSGYGVGKLTVNT